MQIERMKIMKTLPEYSREDFTDWQMDYKFLRPQNEKI